MKKSMYILVISITALLAIIFNHQDKQQLYQYFKPLTTILIIGLALLFNTKNLSKYNLLILMALLFCLVGDIFLLWEDKFVFGLGSFLVGHLFFAGAFIRRFGFNKNIIPLIILGFVAGLYFFYIQPNLGSLRIPVLIYISVIVFMSWQALGRKREANNKKALFLIALGALLFTFSDSIIAYNKFVQSFKLSGAIILSTYWVAITLFAYSTLSIEER